MGLCQVLQPLVEHTYNTKLEKGEHRTVLHWATLPRSSLRCHLSSARNVKQFAANTRLGSVLNCLNFAESSGYLEIFFTFKRDVPTTGEATLCMPLDYL